MWTRQPQSPIGFVFPFRRDNEVVVLGSMSRWNPTARSGFTVGGTVAPVATAGGVGINVSKSNYFSFDATDVTGGTTGWTIAAVVVPLVLSTSTASAIGNGICGFCETPGSGTFDRQMMFQNTTNNYMGYMFDGSVRTLASAAVAVVGVPRAVIVASDGIELVCAVDREVEATSVVSNTGFNGYSSAEFGIGNVNDGSLASTAVLLCIRARTFWQRPVRQAFLSNPWGAFLSLRQATRFGVTSVVTGNPWHHFRQLRAA